MRAVHIICSWGILAGLVWLTGCTTAKQGENASSSKGEKSGVAEEDFSEEAVEQRIEAHAHYATAVVHELNDRTDLAVEEYLKAGLLDSGNEPLVLEVTRKFLQLKQTDPAMELLKKATAKEDASAELFNRLALLHDLLGQTNEAVRASQTAIKKNPKSLQAYQQLAQIQVQQGDYEAASKVIQQGFETADPDAAGLVNLSELCLALSRVDAERREALRELSAQMLDKADSVQMVNPMVLQRMAEGFLAVGQEARASEIYVKLLDRFPNLPGLRDRLIDLYLRQEDKEKASAQLETVLADNPTNVRAHYLLGSLAYDMGNMEGASEHYGKVLLLNPDFEQAYYDLAGTYINLNQSEKALEILQKARGKFPERFVMELYTGLAYSRLKDYEQAVKFYQSAEIIARATETNRLTFGFYFQLGASYERNKQFREAETYLRKSLDLKPDNTEAMNYLGYMWADRGENLEEARQMIQTAVDAQPDNAAYLDSLGWVLFKLDRSQEALEYLLSAVEKSEEPDAVLYDHLGDIYRRLEQEDKAREAWKKSLDLEPNPDIRKKLDGIATFLDPNTD